MGLAAAATSAPAVGARALRPRPGARPRSKNIFSRKLSKYYIKFQSCIHYFEDEIVFINLNQHINNFNPEKKACTNSDISLQFLALMQ